MKDSNANERVGEHSLKGCEELQYCARLPGLHVSGLAAELLDGNVKLAVHCALAAMHHKRLCDFVFCGESGCLDPASVALVNLSRADKGGIEKPAGA